ncbi:uncharacterized protein TNCV_1115391 [Trichonephila clavipes]|nr:uncharacterized protein TNCV_1115391 [Trichonephila clavipes]
MIPVGSLMVRAPDSGPEGLGSMPVPPNTLRVHTEYVLVKSVGPKVLWAVSRIQGTGENFPPPHPFGNFAELNRTVTYMVLKAKANDRRHLAHCHDGFRGPRFDYVRQSPNLEIGSRISRQTWKSEIVNPDDPDQDN